MGVAAEHQLDGERGVQLQTVVAVGEPEHEIVRILPAQLCGQSLRLYHAGRPVAVLDPAYDNAAAAAVQRLKAVAQAAYAV